MHMRRGNTLHTLLATKPARVNWPPFGRTRQGRGADLGVASGTAQRTGGSNLTKVTARGRADIVLLLAHRACSWRQRKKEYHVNFERSRCKCGHGIKFTGMAYIRVCVQ